MLLTANDVGDPLVHVVHDACEQKEHRAVGTGKHEVLDRRVLERRRAAHQVGHDGHAVVRDTEPQCPAGTVLQAPVPAKAVVAAIPVAGAGDSVLPGAVAVVGPPLLVEVLRGCGVLGQAG
jgi:hypothetical protein